MSFEFTPPHSGDPMEALGTLGETIAPFCRPARPRRQPWAKLIEAVLGLAGGEAQLLSHSERAWASATFAGARHRIALAFAGEAGIVAADSFIEALPEHEFTLPRQLVADGQVVAVRQEMLPEVRMLVEAELLVLDE
jgi:hypothetical protein